MRVNGKKGQDIQGKLGFTILRHCHSTLLAEKYEVEYDLVRKKAGYINSMINLNPYQLR